MTAVIIDDEVEAINSLTLDLKQTTSNIEIIGVAKSVKDGIALLKESTPDILFLDIQLSDGLGFDILNQLETRNDLQVIFTTAYNEYILRALKAGAFDYLLKPIDPDELEATLQRVDEKRQQNLAGFDFETIIKLAQGMSKKPRIALNSVEGIYLKDISSIIYIKSESNYCRVFFSDNSKPMLLSKTLKDFEQSLEEHGFIRTHFSYLINQEHLMSYHSRDGGYVVMSNDELIPVSSRKRSDLLEFLKNESRNQR